MNDLPLCTSCGKGLTQDQQFCPHCGIQVTTTKLMPSQQFSKKSGKTALLLCILFGSLGVHRFYVGKIFTGLLALITGGGLFTWTVVDLTLLIRNKFKDSDGARLNLSDSLSSGQRFGLIIGSVIIWLVVTVGLALTLLSALTNQLIVVADNQLAALRFGNIKEAYSYNANEYQKAISIEQFKTWLSEYPDLTNNVSATFSNRGLSSYKGFLDAGFLEGVVKSTSGHELSIKYYFVKEDGSWKILAIVTPVGQ